MFPGLDAGPSFAPASRPRDRDGERRRGGEPRIGVFVCHCGHNIAGYLDVADLVDTARALPGVVFADDSLFACSDAGLAGIRGAVQEHRLNRVVVASCTPRTHEPLFQATCEEAGLNRYLFEFVNIRDQCSWVHMNDRPRATHKAHDLVRMGVARAALLQPLVEVELAVQPTAAIIGGGMAGMTAALSLARRGFGVTVIEREPELGGLLRVLDRLYPTGQPAQDLMAHRAVQVRAHPNIEVLTSAYVTQVKGYVGNYELLVHSQAPWYSSSAGQAMDVPIQAGAIIVATGADEWKPSGLYGYGHDPCVITQGELEESLVHGLLPRDRCAKPSSLSSVVMIQCVGARDEARPYCGRTCCLTAIKNAIRLKQREPSTEVYLLYRDIEVHGTHFEDYYGQARDLGIVFTRYQPDDPPQVQDNRAGRAPALAECTGTRGRVLVYDELLGARLSIPYDLLVLSTPLVPRDGARELARMLKVPVDEHGFFLEAHVKLRPLDFATDGIYLCGSAHWPAHLDEAISQALGAAARAATILSRDRIRSSGVVARVEERLCRGCRRCADVCEHGAIDFTPVPIAFLPIASSPPVHSPSAVGREAPGQLVARINPVLCKGCGACTVICPTSALQAAHFTSEQVTAMIRAAVAADACPASPEQQGRKEARGQAPVRGPGIPEPRRPSR